MNHTHSFYKASTIGNADVGEKMTLRSSHAGFEPGTSEFQSDVLTN